MIKERKKVKAGVLEYPILSYEFCSGVTVLEGANGIIIGKGVPNR